MYLSGANSRSSFSGQNCSSLSSKQMREKAVLYSQYGACFVRGMKAMQKRIMVVLFLLVLATPALSQRVADFPFDSVTSVVSPDGRFEIQGQHCTAETVETCERKIWVVDRSTNDRSLLFEYNRTVRIGWAPAGNKLFLDNEQASNESFSYVYFLPSAKRLDIGAMIDKAYPRDRRFEADSHHYVNGIRWVSSRELMVKRFGHFDHPVRGGNGFTVCYLVRTSGAVKRLNYIHSDMQSEGANCAAQSRTR
jgi:hypothetical protein